MASATETAIAALFTKLGTVRSSTSKIAAPTRNDDLSERLANLTVGSDTVKSFANLWDGSQREREEVLGVDQITDGYAIVHEARLELAFVGGPTASVRDTAHDDALAAVSDALASDRQLKNGGSTVNVDWVEFGQPEGQGSGLVTDGIPGAKGVIVPILLQFRSSRPF